MEKGKWSIPFRQKYVWQAGCVRAREVCTYCGVYGSPGMLLPDNSVFKKSKCFGFRMAHKLGKKDACKAFSRKQKGKVSVSCSVCQGRKPFPLELLMHFCVCISPKKSVLAWMARGIHTAQDSEWVSTQGRRPTVPCLDLSILIPDFCEYLQKSAPFGGVLMQNKGK